MTRTPSPKIIQILDTMPICPQAENGFGLHDMKAVDTGVPRAQEWMCGKCPTTIEVAQLDSGSAWVRLVDARGQVTTSSITEGVHLG
jgi:hypothetical protein